MQAGTILIFYLYSAATAYLLLFIIFAVVHRSHKMLSCSSIPCRLYLVVAFRPISSAPFNLVYLQALSLWFILKIALPPTLDCVNSRSQKVQPSLASQATYRLRLATAYEMGFSRPSFFSRFAPCHPLRGFCFHSVVLVHQQNPATAGARSN